MRRFRRKMKEDKNFNFLKEQVEGLIYIELGNYAYKKGYEIYIFGESEINVYVERIGLNYQTEFEVSPPEILHLHENDLLWFIVTFMKNKKDYLKSIDNCIEFKEKYQYKE